MPSRRAMYARSRVARYTAASASSCRFDLPSAATASASLTEASRVAGSGSPFEPSDA